MIYHSKKNYVKVAMILAAGFGTRLGSITEQIPKALVKLNGVSILDRCIGKILQLDSISKIIINTHYKADQIKTHLEKYQNDKIPIILSEEEQILETGGGIMNAMHNIACESFVIMNVDILLLDKITNSLQKLIEFWDPEKMDALLLLVDKNRVKDYIGTQFNGDFNLNAAGKIFHSQDSNDLVYIGAAILSPAFFKDQVIGKFPLSKILFQSNEYTCNQYKYYGMLLPETSIWFDIGTPETLDIAAKHLLLKNEIFF